MSTITDPKTISIVGSVPLLEKVSEYARSQGLLVQGMHLRGKVHNPENTGLAEELCRLADLHNSLSLPYSTGLHIPIRSNINGNPISEVPLSHEVIRTVLASRCEWYTLLQGIAEDLDHTGRKSHLFTIFGIGDCVPLSPFHKKQLQVVKLDVLSVVQKHLDQQSTSASTSPYSFPDHAIAIVGAACRLPGADSLEELWDLLASGASKAVEVPTTRFNLHGSFKASQDQKWSSKQKFFGNFIDDIEGFDSTFFRTSPKEAVNMDPQQRVLLEVAYQAMESSGYLRSHERNSGDNIGCFIGASFVEYLDNTSSHPPTAYTSTGTIRAFLSGKISYYFGWHGPSEVIDTACSSSLVAINRACKAIQAGECPMALAGGVNVLAGIHNFLDLAKAGFLSPTGQCKPFDASADGYCRAEGCSLVVLKPLKQAIADNQQILGVIAGVSTNQGGLSPSITVPYPPAQIKLYQQVLKQANMKSDQVSYIEAHGTGTQAGDPLELASVREVFGSTSRSIPLVVGSLKGNIGHSETAAGAASLCKILAMLQYGVVPPLANHSSLNPKIPPLGPDKMRITTLAEPWDVSFRAACINSYGAAGSNSALICCQYPAGPMTSVARAPLSKLAFPVILSAASKESLVAYAQKLCTFLNRPDFKHNMADLAFTLTERRKHHPVRYVGEFSDIFDFKKALESVSESYFEAQGSGRKICLAFSGQSRQTVGLEKSLYESIPRLKYHVNCCNEIVMRLGYPPLIPLVFAKEPLLDIVTLQCGTFALQYAFAMCWIESGLKVAVVVGHSFGELTALAVSGVLSLEDGLKLVAARASLMQTKWGSERGTMMAIHNSRDVVDDIIRTARLPVEVACYNSSASQVVVGTAAEIIELEEIIATTAAFKSTRTQRLGVSHGFHSIFTEPLFDGLEQVTQSLSFQEARIPLETCTAKQCSIITAHRVREHTRSPVFFEDAVRRIEDRHGSCIWIEAGTGSPIIPMVEKAVNDQQKHIFIRFGASSFEDMLSPFRSATLRLWREGIKASYIQFLETSESGFKQIWMPPCVFQRTKHWLLNVDRAIEALQRNPPIEASAFEKTKGLERLMFVSRNGSSKTSLTATFAVNVETRRYRTIVSGHAVRQRALCPASIYMECVVMAAQILGAQVQKSSISFKCLSYQSALGLDSSRDVFLSMEPIGKNGAWSYVCKSRSKANGTAKETTHGIGQIYFSDHEHSLKSYQRVISSRIRDLSQRSDVETLRSNRAYGLFSRVVTYAPLLRGISSIILADTEALASIEVPSSDADTGESTVTAKFDAIALDTFIQVVGLLINSSNRVAAGEVFIAAGIESASLSAGCDFNKAKSWTVYSMYTPLNDRQVTGDIYVFTKGGALVVTILGFQFTKVPITMLEKLLDAATPQPLQRKHSTSTPIMIKENCNSWIGSPSLEDYGDEADTPLTDLGSEDEEGGLASKLDGVDVVKSLIAQYTGLTRSQIPQDAAISDLGVDSLAAVELANDLESKFGKPISTEDLMISTISALMKHFGIDRPTPKAKMTLKPSLPPPEPIEHPQEGAQNGTYPSSSPLDRGGPMTKLLEIIAENCGAPVSSIKFDCTLQDLGVDSLSAIELKSEVEEAFKVGIGDDDLSLDSTVQEIIVCLGLEITPWMKTGLNRSANDNLRTISKSFELHAHQAVQDEKTALTMSPFDALLDSEKIFESMSQIFGYAGYWKQVAPQQDRLLLAYLISGFKDLGADLSRLKQGDILPEVKFLEKHRKVMARVFEILQRLGIVVSSGDAFIRTSKQISYMPTAELTEVFLKKHPKYRCEAELMALTGPLLAQCLTGKVDPVSLLFGNPTSLAVLEDFYINSPMLATMTAQLVEMVAKIVRRNEGSTPYRIMEVGAGFGGTTKALVQALSQTNLPVEYIYTDISPMLVKNARRKMSSSYPLMSFRTFNLEDEKIPDDLVGNYDLVISTNCIHATSNKTTSLRRIRKLLRPNGCVILSEVTCIFDWYEIVYGLLDGWWLASEYPLQPAETWMKYFKDAGFDSYHYSTGMTSESRSQRLLVASTRDWPIPGRVDTSVAPVQHGSSQFRATVYKTTDGVEISADIFLPARPPPDPMGIGKKAVLDNTSLLSSNLSKRS